MQTSEALRESDPAVVARYLQLRTVFHDRYLARVERLALERYDVELTNRIPPTLAVQVRGTSSHAASIRSRTPATVVRSSKPASSTVAPTSVRPSGHGTM